MIPSIPSVSQIADQIVSSVQARIGQTIPQTPRNLIRIIALAVAGVVFLSYKFSEWAYRQIFTATADEDAIITRAREYGLTRDPATNWIGQGTTTGPTGVTIPAGTLYSINGNVYQVTTSVVISGLTTVALESLEPGEAVDLEIGDTVTITTPQVWDRTITITAVTQIAEDAEDVESLRQRLIFRQQNPPQGGAFPDWILWTTQVPGIREAFVERPVAGFVNVFPLTDDADPANRVPGALKLTEVFDYISDPVRSPIRAAEISVLAMDELDFDVDITGLTPDNATLRQTILTDLTAYFYSRRPKQYSDQAVDLSVISAGAITARAIGAGAQSLTVTLKNAGGTPITDYTLDISELAVLRALTWI